MSKISIGFRQRKWRSRFEISNADGYNNADVRYGDDDIDGDGGTVSRKEAGGD